MLVTEWPSESPYLAERILRVGGRAACRPRRPWGEPRSENHGNPGQDVGCPGFGGPDWSRTTGGAEGDRRQSTPAPGAQRPAAPQGRVFRECHDHGEHAAGTAGRHARHGLRRCVRRLPAGDHRLREPARRPAGSRRLDLPAVLGLRRVRPAHGGPHPHRRRLRRRPRAQEGLPGGPRPQRTRRPRRALRAERPGGLGRPGPGRTGFGRAAAHHSRPDQPRGARPA